MLMFKTMIRKYPIVIFSNGEMIRIDFNQFQLMFHYATLIKNNFSIVYGTQRYQINTLREPSIIFIDGSRSVQE